MSKIKLKRCPFCGGEVRLMCYLDEGIPSCINYEDELEMDCAFVYCNNCDMDFFPHTETAREVLEAWNTRKPMQEIVERLEEVKEERMEVAQHTLDLVPDGQVWGLRKAIEIVKEVGGIE